MPEKFNIEIDNSHKNKEQEKILNKSKEFQFPREAAKVTLDKISSWEELNAATIEEADKKFKEKTKETWKEFAVSGVLQFDKKEGKQVLKPFTDLDGRSALGILKEAGIDTSNLTYVRPGESLKGVINLDTGDKFGVVYEDSSYTLFFDHHAKETKVTSTAEIVYKAMSDLGMIKKSEAMDKLVDFVTKIDNRQFPPEEFLKSAKTILGLQRDLDFDKLLLYFKDHANPTEELSPEEFEKYGLKDSAEKQQKTINEAMETLGRMEKEGKVIDTKFGKIVVNENNELKVGASAAYVKFDGIINFTSEKSFAITLKEKDFNEEDLRNKLGDKFQGKVIRGKMWLYNEAEPLKLSLREIIQAVTLQDKIFDPEIELKKILEQPKNKRGDALKRFKEKLYHQKLNLAATEVELLKKAEENPNITIVDIEDVIKQKSYSLTEKQKSFLKKGAQEYLKKRDAIRDFLKNCLDNNEINSEKVYEKIFDAKCTGRPEITVSDLSITLFLNERDFYNALKTDRIKQGWAENTDLFDVVESSAAIQLPLSIEGLEEFVIIAKSKHISKKNDIIQHERQHIYHDLISNIYDSEWKEVLFRLKQKEIINDDELEKLGKFEDSQAEKLYNLIKQRNEYLIGAVEDVAVKESQIKDEILSYFKIGIPPKKIYKGILADYYGTFIDRKEINFVKNSVSGVDDLLKSGFSKDETLSLLYKEPISKWPKISKRIIFQYNTEKMSFIPKIEHLFRGGIYKITSKLKDFTEQLK